MSLKDYAHTPEGFVRVTGPDGTPCLVPEFLIPATNQAFEGYRKRLELGVNKKDGGVSPLLMQLKFTLFTISVVRKLFRNKLYILWR
jgi:hypothetical protein